MSLSDGSFFNTNLYEASDSNHTPVQLSGTNSAAERFNSTKTFDSVSVNCPSWNNNLGNLTLSLYKWNSNYNTTISSAPIVSKQFVDFVDNDWLEINFAPQSAGEYLWVLNNPSETVGVYKFDGSSNGSTAYLNGSVVSGDYVSKIGYETEQDLYQASGNHTAVQLTGTNTAAEKFNSAKVFDRVSVNCPSWSNNIGNLTLSLYKWNTDYNTTVSATPIASRQFVNYTDNQWLEMSFESQSAGDYLWVLSSPVETVGVYKYDGSSNNSTAYLNGSVVTGDYMSKISYKTNEYFYIRNVQGDIIGLVDESGKQVVSYTYDTWGKLISTSGTLASTVGAKNPYRYRGYRYDTETGLYYLQSRYYNPEWGRFINEDAIAAVTGDVLSTNMYAYCLNNPVNMSDDNGDRPDFDKDDYDEEFKEWQEELYEQKQNDRLRSSDSKKREKKNVDSAWGKRGSKEREGISEEAHKAKKKYGKGNDDNFGWNDLKNKEFNKCVLTPRVRIVIGVGGSIIIAGTIAEDIFTGGVGVADDPETISGGAGLIIRAFAAQ